MASGAAGNDRGGRAALAGLVWISRRGRHEARIGVLAANLQPPPSADISAPCLGNLPAGLYEQVFLRHQVVAMVAYG